LLNFSASLRYCHPPGEPSGFSYGLAVTAFDPETLKFEGEPLIKGRWELEEGQLEYANKYGQKHVYIRYKEVWGNGFEDHIFAR